MASDSSNESGWYGAPWVRFGVPYRNLSETDPTLNKVLVPHWAKMGGLEYKTLSGNEHAWCSLFIDWSMTQAGHKGTGNAMASSWRTWGNKGDYWFGAVLGIRHASGGGHVTFFLYWVDKAKHLAACMGGNQGNHLNVTCYNLSGNHSGQDEVVNGPRWPAGVDSGKEVSKDDVLKAHPELRVGAGAGSTT